MSEEKGERKEPHMLPIVNLPCFKQTLNEILGTVKKKGKKWRRKRGGGVFWCSSRSTITSFIILPSMPGQNKQH